MADSTMEDKAYDTALAVIGLSGRFPGANTIETFWHNIAGGVKSIHRFSDEELLRAGVDPGQLKQPNYVKAGTLLEAVDCFDAAFFGYTPREAEIMDPQHRLFLECAWEALEDAAYDPESYPGLIGVFAGSGFSTYMVHNIFPQRELLQMIGQLQIDVGNERDALASTVSYKLNLKGPGIAVQTFCSTSLVATHLACQSLLSYECDIALAGGVAITIPQERGYNYEEGGIVSPDGECRTFDERGQGSVMGNGIGVVVIKRLSDALMDHDHIYAVVRGSAVNNDGSMRVSYTAPGLNGQKEVIAEALGNADVDVESISYIEAHGTATRLGDAVELAALMKAFGGRTQKKGFCALGSVKPNVGHLDRAAGVTGLIKTVLALHRKQLPPSLNFERTSPDIDLASSPFYVNTQLQEWKANGGPRRAGVSSFGLGGTNAHVVLEEAPEITSTPSSRDWHLLLLSAKTEGARSQAEKNILAYLKTHTDTKLADISYTLQIGRAAFNQREVIVCQDLPDAIQAIERKDPKRLFTAHQVQRDRPVAFLFPGVGDHYTGIVHDLYHTEAIFKASIDQCCSLVDTSLGNEIRTLLITSPKVANQRSGMDLRAIMRRGSDSLSVNSGRIKQTMLAQPAIFILEYALAQQLKAWGIQPQALAGYSSGEYVAACLAGIFSLQDALKLVTGRAQLIQELPQGAMLAVALSEDAVKPFLDEGVSLAAVNGPATCVVAGPDDTITWLENHLIQQGIVARRVDTTHAFHSFMLESAREGVTELARSITLHPPRIPTLSNVTGTWMTDEQATDAGYWAEHMCQTVRFMDGARELLKKSEWMFLEVGPGQALSSFLKQMCESDQIPLIQPTLPSANEQQPDYFSLMTALGKLWLSGVTINWATLYEQEERKRCSLPTYPFERQRYWLDPPQQGNAEPWLIAQNPLPPGKVPAIEDWFYLPTWEQTPLPLDGTEDVEKKTGNWLIFTEANTLTSSVATCITSEYQSHRISVLIGEQFREIDEQTFTINPASKDDYSQLIKHLHSQKRLPRAILHGWTLSNDSAQPPDITQFQKQQDRGFYSLLYLTQALGDQVYEEPVQIIVLTHQACAITSQESIQAKKTPILGICKVIPQEHLNIRCRVIDIVLPDLNKTRSYNQTLELIMKESLATSNEPVVVYRQKQRWRQSYKALPLPARPTLLRQEGVYLITGGLGDIGLVLAEHLAKTVQARIVLISRSGLPPRSEWITWLKTHEEQDPTSHKIRRIQAMEQQGAKVLVMRVDVADPTQVDAIIEQIYRHFGTLHGVIHAAGISTESAFRPIQDLGRAECEMHFQPKVYGLMALEQALQGKELDFCLLFSSLSAVLGGLGFAGYTAANIFIDAFVHTHNLQNPTTPWISVDWDTWQLKEDAHGVLGSTIAAFAMNAKEGVEAFERVLAHNIPHLVESTGNLEARIKQWLQLTNATHNNTQQAISSEGSGRARPDLTTAYVAPETELQQDIAAIWQHLLGIERIGIYDNFFELGGHSLIGTQLISRLRQTFQVNLPLATLFEAPTIVELANEIETRLIAEIDQLDEEVAQRMVQEISKGS